MKASQFPVFDAFGNNNLLDFMDRNVAGLFFCPDLGLQSDGDLFIFLVKFAYRVWGEANQHKTSPTDEKWQHHDQQNRGPFRFHDEG